jgi:hypothetical protein
LQPRLADHGSARRVQIDRNVATLDSITKWIDLLGSGFCLDNVAIISPAHASDVIVINHAQP